MPYSADISRVNPACFLFLIDQSGSMTEALSGQPGHRKMDQAADAINRILDTLSQRCSQGLEIRDYFHVGIIAYNTDSRGNPTINSVLRDTTIDDPFLRISEVVDTAEVVERTVKESDGAGGVVEVTRKVPDMVEALREDTGLLWSKRCQSPPGCSRTGRTHTQTRILPIVINVTDGMATDGDPEPQAREIMGRETKDGNTLPLQRSPFGCTCHASPIP